MESLEVNPVTREIGANVLGKTVSTAFSLIGHEITPDDLRAYHRLKNKDRVILKSKKLKKLNWNKQKSSAAKIFGTLSIIIFW